MTKEEMYNNLWKAHMSAYPSNMADVLNAFFKQNVVIPKGENRHPYADVLHEWAEDTTKELQYLSSMGGWARSDWNDALSIQYRIKPSEPIYEAMVRTHYADGTYEDTQKYFTYEEFENFGFPKSCEWVESTKRERKQ